MQSCRRLVEASDTVYGVVWAYIRHWRIHLRAGSTGHHGLSLLFPEWPADTGLSLIQSDAAKATAGTGGAGRFGSAFSSPSSHRRVRFGQRGTWGKTHGRGQYPLGVAANHKTDSPAAFLMDHGSLERPEKWKSRRWRHRTSVSGLFCCLFSVAPELLYSSSRGSSEFIGADGAFLHFMQIRPNTGFWLLPRSD